jgi:hypothetical protein
MQAHHAASDLLPKTQQRDQQGVATAAVPAAAAAAVGGGDDDIAACNAADPGMVVLNALEGNSWVCSVLEDGGNRMGFLGGMVEGVMGWGSMVKKDECKQKATRNDE